MKSTNKLILKLFNVVIGLLCILAIFGYVVKPVWEVTLTVTFNEDLAKKLYPQAYEDTQAEDDDEEANELINDIVKELAETKTELSTSLCLNSKHFYNAIISNSNKPVDDILSDVVDNALNSDKIDTSIDNIIKSAAKSTAKTAVKTTLNELKNNADYSFELGDKDTETVMNDIGFTDEYIDKKTDILYEALTSDKTVESITDDTIMPMVDEIYAMIKDSEYGSELPAALNAEDRNQLRDSVTEALEAIAYESNGEKQVNIKGKIYQLISDALDNNDAAVSVNDNLMLLSSEGGATSDTADNTADEQVSIEDIKQQLKDMLIGSVSDDAKDVLLIVMKVVAGILLFSILTWLYLLIKIIVKSFSDKPGTKLKLPILLGWLPSIPLVIIPAVFTSLISGSNNLLTQNLPADSIAELQSTFGALSIKFSSGSAYALIAAIALIVIFIPYGIFRKKAKREAAAN